MPAMGQEHLRAPTGQSILLYSNTVMKRQIILLNQHRLMSYVTAVTAVPQFSGTIHSHTITNISVRRGHRVIYAMILME
jgi:hypothetical protein